MRISDIIQQWWREANPNVGISDVAFPLTVHLDLVPSPDKYNSVIDGLVAISSKESSGCVTKAEHLRRGRVYASIINCNVTLII